MYENGHGVTKDEAKAVEWYQKSAEQGHDSAQLLLGNMYEFGKGVAKDEATAMKWYRKSAAQGNAEAQSKISSHQN
jgi:TPR repeat protein